MHNAQQAEPSPREKLTGAPRERPAGSEHEGWWFPHARLGAGPGVLSSWLRVPSNRQNFQTTKLKQFCNKFDVLFPGETSHGLAGHRASRAASTLPGMWGKSSSLKRERRRRESGPGCGRGRFPRRVSRSGFLG